MTEVIFRPGLEPQAVSIPLVPYSKNKELFASTGSTDQFVEDMIEQADIDPDPLTPPHVLHLDFRGLVTLNPNNAVVALETVLKDLRGNSKPVYSVFDYVAPSIAQQLEEVFSRFDKTKPVVIARRAARSDYGLLGDREKIGRYGRSWEWIAGQQHWIQRSTMRRVLGFDKEKANSTFPKMAKEGLILQAGQGVVPIDHTVYYRRLT